MLYLDIEILEGSVSFHDKRLLERQVDLFSTFNRPDRDSAIAFYRFPNDYDSIQDQEVNRVT